MTEPDLTTLLREHLTDEPPLAHTSTDVIRTARKRTARRGLLAGGVAALAVAAVALAPSLSTSGGDDGVPATGAEQAPPVTEVMETAAGAGFAAVPSLGEPSWSVNNVLGEPVEAGDADAQHYLLSYRPATGPTQLNLTVGGFAPEDLETYDFAGSCRYQLEQRRAETCTIQTLEDGSLLMTSVALRSGIDTDAPRMLTPQEAKALPAGAVSRVRVVSLSTLDGMAVDAAEYVPVGARWSISLDDLQALALDPGLRAADVAHEPMPLFTDE
ncbi:hypothetical protein [Nocardioides sp. SR21]|uniref:hypothetical protein n=1 Tax=Nocardioides sp. SR21 TaxID=2919501 RepID=UPI001FAA9BB0|nr:hypothetical protein [Nocardioides sp. SR21]